MNCERARDLVVLFLAGELAMEESEVLRPHLMTCPDCTRFMSEQRRLSAELACIPDVEPSEGFALRTATTIREGLRARRCTPWSRLAVSREASWVAAIAAGLLVFAALRWLPGGIADLPYDLSFLEPPAPTATPIRSPVASWDSSDVEDALAALRADLDRAVPGAGSKSSDRPETATDTAVSGRTWSSTPSSNSGKAWDSAVGALERRADALEWDVTLSGRSGWGSRVEELQADLESLARSIDES